MIILYSTLLFTILYFAYSTYIKAILCKFKILIDEPNKLRKLHKKPIPSGGGIIFSLIGFAFGIIFNMKIFIISFPLALVGLMDDMFKISPIKRFLVQISVGFFLILNSDIFKKIIENLSFLNILLLFLLALIFITGTINLTNFMDGLDGLVIGSFLIIFIYLSFFQSLQYLPFTISLIAFLVFNWPPARLFMGDSGSTYLGAIFIGICINQENFNEIIKIFLLAFPLYADSSLTLLSRIFKEKSQIFRPHKKHFYQRLYEAGYSKSQISSSFALSIFFNALLLELFGMIGICISAGIELVLGLYFNNIINRKLYLTK